MIKRTIEISGGPSYLAIRNGQLLIRRGSEQIAQAPCEDIGMLLIDEFASTYSHPALVALLEQGAAVVLCGSDHLPVGLLLPVSGNQLLTQRLAAQVHATKPLCKRLWQQIVRCKIRHQAEAIGRDHPRYRKLRNLEKEVKSGDISNVEAQAAKVYWSAYLGEQSFRRDPDGPSPNNLLNYGYAVIRAAVARAICTAGLHPSIGLHHHNRYNAFCLADDLMEPFRPMVDSIVGKLWEQGYQEINRETKTGILELLAAPVVVKEQQGPLMVQLHRIVASLCQCFEGSCNKMELPEP